MIITIIHIIVVIIIIIIVVVIIIITIIIIHIIITVMRAPRLQGSAAQAALHARRTFAASQETNINLIEFERLNYILQTIIQTDTKTDRRQTFAASPSFLAWRDTPGDMYVCMCIYIYIYIHTCNIHIYIYIERERCKTTYIYIYIYTANISWLGD